MKSISGNIEWSESDTGIWHSHFGDSIWITESTRRELDQDSDRNLAIQNFGVSFRICDDLCYMAQPPLSGEENPNVAAS